MYVTTLNSLPTQHPGLRSSINRNLSDIVELHEEILYELRRAVPNSELTQLYEQPTTTTPAAKAAHHHRWRSLDSVPEDEGGLGWLQDVPGLMADPDVAAAVSKIFRERVSQLLVVPSFHSLGINLAQMHRFFVYEEYGAKYEMMIKDVAATARTLPQWEMYQKGLEALAASLGSINQQLDQSKKSLTIGDLLVKVTPPLGLLATL